MIWLAIPYMTWLSRMAGGGWPKLPYGLDQWLLAAPYLLFYPVIGWLVVPAYLGAVLGLRTGHGSGFYYWEKFKKNRTVEKIEKIISGALSYHVQKVLIMALTGLAVTLTCSILLLFHGYGLAALILGISGIGKAACYSLPKTEWAEYARGFLLGCGFVAAMMVV